METISFVIINRNNRLYLNKCLESIDKLTYQNKEIVLVDDHSTDDSLHLLDIKPHKLIKHHRNLGIAPSRNKGVKQSKGKIVFIIDSDIEITRVNIKKIVNVFEKNEKLVALSGKYISKGKSNGNKILDARRIHIFGKDKKEIVYNLNNYTTFSGGFCAIHKERLGNITQKGKPLVGGEDILFQLKLINKGYKFSYVPYMIGTHHHKRNTRKTILKAKSEAKGDVWLTSEALKQGIRLPIFISIFSFPIFLLAGIIFLQPPLVFIEFLPNLYLIVRHRKLVFVYLLLYDFLLYIFYIYYTFIFLIGNESLNIKAKYLYNGIKCNILGKYYWFKNQL